MCVGGCFSENLPKSQRNEGLDRSYRGINLNLPASVFELQLTLNTMEKMIALYWKSIPLIMITIIVEEMRWQIGNCLDAFFWDLYACFHSLFAASHVLRSTYSCSTSRWIIEEESKLWSGKGVSVCKHISSWQPLVFALKLTDYSTALMRLSTIHFLCDQPPSQAPCACQLLNRFFPLLIVLFD